MSARNVSLCGMNTNEHPHVVYRYRGNKNELLYIGRSNDPLRRAGEHIRSKPWTTSTVRIDLEWVPADLVHEMERQAIESEHPRYNVQHNRGVVRFEVAAEVRVPSAGDFAALLAAATVMVLGAKWGFDAAANWNVKRRAARAGIEVELPLVKNPFTGGGPDWLQALLAVAAMPPDELQRAMAAAKLSPAPPETES